MLKTSPQQPMACKRSVRFRSLLLVVQLLGQCLASQADINRFSNGTCVRGINGFPLTPVFNTCPIPVNELTAFRTDTWSPWSHRPECNAVDKVSSQYCIFTDDTFRAGQGMSILTTAEVASGLTNVLDDSNVPPSFRHFLAVGADEAPYRVVDIPGRGKGTIATRKIKELETVMMSYPALLAINDIEGVSYGEIMRLLEKGVDQLSPQERGNVLSLSRSNYGESPIGDIARTNSFGVDIGGVEHMGLFTLTSVCFFFTTANDSHWVY